MKMEVKMVIKFSLLLEHTFFKKYLSLDRSIDHFCPQNRYIRIRFALLLPIAPYMLSSTSIEVLMGRPALVARPDATEIPCFAAPSFNQLESFGLPSLLGPSAPNACPVSNPDVWTPQ